MIIHSYLTKGMMPWAETYLRSLNYYHPNIKTILSTRNLNEEDIRQLKQFHENLEIRNKKFDFELLSLKTGISLDNLKRFEKEILDKKITEENKILKQAISVEDRYRLSIMEIIEENINKNETLLHTDIDIFFKKPIHELIEFINMNDISIGFRLYNEKESRKVVGGVIGFKINPNLLIFMYRWFHHIDRISLIDKPIGYGQTSFYYAYKDLIDQYKWGDIPEKFISPRFDDDVVISVGKARYAVDFTLKYYKQRLRDMSKLFGGFI